MNLANLRGQHRVHQLQRRLHVVLKVLARVADRFADVGRRGQSASRRRRDPRLGRGFSPSEISPSISSKPSDSLRFPVLRLS